MQRSRQVDGFGLSYLRSGGGPAVLLLHGWPGDHTDYRDVVPLLEGRLEVLLPDLRGFGRSDKHLVDPAAHYGQDGQTRSVLGLLDELGIERVVIGGYDVGSRVAQAVARAAPDRVAALVVTPPLPGVGRRILDPGPQQQFWYQSFHQLDLAEQLVDGRPDAVRAYLKHFWSHWSGPAFTPAEADLDQLVQVYGEPGAFVASIGWYRAGAAVVARALAEQVPDPADRLAVPTTVLWPEHDPLFPPAWADRLGEFFTDATVLPVAGVGHFVPREAPAVFAGALLEACR